MANVYAYLKQNEKLTSLNRMEWKAFNEPRHISDISSCPNIDFGQIGRSRVTTWRIRIHQIGYHECDQIRWHFRCDCEILSNDTRLQFSVRNKSRVVEGNLTHKFGNKLSTKRMRKLSYVIDVRGMLDNAIDLRCSCIKLISNFAFLSGRSKQGNARRASIGENCVLASHLKYEKKRIINGMGTIWLTGEHYFFVSLPLSSYSTR